MLFNSFPFCSFWWFYCLHLSNGLKQVLAMLLFVCFPSSFFFYFLFASNVPETFSLLPDTPYHALRCSLSTLPPGNLHGFPLIIFTLLASSRGQIYLQLKPVIIADSYFGKWRRGQCSCLWLWLKSECWANSSGTSPWSSCYFLWVPNAPHL